MGYLNVAVGVKCAECGLSEGRRSRCGGVDGICHICFDQCTFLTFASAGFYNDLFQLSPSASLWTQCGESRASREEAGDEGGEREKKREREREKKRERESECKKERQIEVGEDRGGVSVGRVGGRRAGRQGGREGPEGGRKREGGRAGGSEGRTDRRRGRGGGKFRE